LVQGRGGREVQTGGPPQADRGFDPSAQSAKGGGQKTILKQLLITGRV